MEPEGLLPHSQEPATCTYPKPDQSIPCLPPIPVMESRSWFYLQANWLILLDEPHIIDLVYWTFCINLK
jgi:hypothetical protein